MKKLIIALFLLTLIATPCSAEQYFVQNESSSARRLFYFFLTLDGTTIATAEAGGQPTISINGATPANTSNTLNHIDNGGYYVDLTAAEVGTLGKILIRYDSANTVEFKDIGNVQEPTSLASDLSSLRSMLNNLINVVNWLKWKLEHEAREKKYLQEITEE